MSEHTGATTERGSGVSDLLETRDIERWHRAPVPLCPALRTEPDPCDCGYVGDWLVRHWRDFQPCSKTWADITTRKIHRRCAECVAGGPGHLVFVGWEERCPRCGDEERFLYDGTLVGQARNPAFTGSRDHSLDDAAFSAYQPLPGDGGDR